MSDNDQVLQLLTAALESNRAPQEVCADCPELLPEVQLRWEECQRMIGEIDMLFPQSDAQSETGPAPARYQTNQIPQIAGYEVGPMLGRGGMGVVYRALHLGLNRTIALKMLLSGAYASPVELARFLREARAIAGLKHPNLVQVYDVGEFEGRPFYTMELVDGGTLAEKLGNTPQPSAEVAAILVILADAVDAAHRGGIVHRDLKPSNILLTPDGIPKISDFGLARRFEDEVDLTQSGTRVGTPCYMAPEQATNRTGEVGPPADLYSLGAIFYEMLTGRPPFRGETVADTMRQLVSDEPVPPSRLNSGVPRDLETICLKCLQKDPRRRYETAAALAKDLGRFQNSEPITARPVNIFERAIKWIRRRPTQATLLVIILMIAIGSIGSVLWFLSARSTRNRVVKADLLQVDDLERHGKWDEARNALLRANIELNNHGPAELRDQLDQDKRDLDLVARLESIKLVHPNTFVNVEKADIDNSYSAAFKDAGLELFGNDTASVAIRMKNSPVHQALTDAIDDWITIRGDWPNRRWLLEVVMLSDQNLTEWRRKARNSQVFYDKNALDDVIATAPIADEPPSFLADLGWELTMHKENAAPFLTRVQQQYPNDFWVNLTLGYAELDAKDKADAIRYFQAAVVIKPTAAISQIGLCAVLLASGRADEAVVYGRNGVRLDPSVADAHATLGMALWKSSHLDEALEQFQLGIKLDPKSELAHVMFAQCLEKLGRQSEAMDEYRKALSLDPTDAIALSKVGPATGSSNPLEQRWADWKKSLDADPPDHEKWSGYLELCLYLRHEGEYRRARSRMLSLFGNTTDPHVAERTGRACLLLPASEEETRKAVALIDRALSADKSSVEPWAPAYFQLAKALAEFRQGHLQSATEILHGPAMRALIPAPQLILAMTLQQQGKSEEARVLLESAISLFDWSPNQAIDSDSWMFHVLRRQAEKMIGPSTLPTSMP